ncbi:MAG: hypothetical protein ABIH85_07275 [Candidatus Omnitrophota bacterium]
MNLKEIGQSFIGLIMFVAMLLLPAILFLGIAKVSAFLYPIINMVASLCIIFFVVLVLPLSIFSKLRRTMATVSYFMSTIIGVGVWMFSFLTIWYVLGWWAFLCLFLVQAVAPIALVGSLMGKQFSTAISIGLGLLFTYGIRIYGIWLLTKCEEGFEDNVFDEIIDVPVENKERTMPRYCPRCDKEYDDTWEVCLNCSIKLKRSDCEA